MNKKRKFTTGQKVWLYTDHPQNKYRPTFYEMVVIGMRPSSKYREVYVTDIRDIANIRASRLVFHMDTLTAMESENYHITTSKFIKVKRVKVQKLKTIRELIHAKVKNASLKELKKYANN